MTSLLLALLLQGAAVLSAQGVPAAKAPDPRHVVGEPLSASRTGVELDEEAARVGALLRCPVCQGLSVADSPTGMALDMRAQVREMVQAGYAEEQVLSYFEKSYGEFVRLEPPLRGVNWLVWVGPLAGLLLGAFVVARALRTPPRRAVAARTFLEPLPGPDMLPDDPALARQVLRVRELAYGWPGGISPASAEAKAGP
jgi:cytochrome c-type biogenesis protein CcmH